MIDEQTHQAAKQHKAELAAMERAAEQEAEHAARQEELLEAQTQAIEEASFAAEMAAAEVAEEHRRTTANAWKLQAEAKSDRALSLYHSGMFDEAYKLAIQSVEQDPGNLDGFWVAAASLLSLQSPNKARPYLEKLIQLLNLPEYRTEPECFVQVLELLSKQTDLFLLGNTFSDVLRTNIPRWQESGKHSSRLVEMLTRIEFLDEAASVLNLRLHNAPLSQETLQTALALLKRLISRNDKQGAEKIADTLAKVSRRLLTETYLYEMYSLLGKDGARRIAAFLQEAKIDSRRAIEVDICQIRQIASRSELSQKTASNVIDAALRKYSEWTPKIEAQIHDQVNANVKSLEVKTGGGWCGFASFFVLTIVAVGYCFSQGVPPESAGPYFPFGVLFGSILIGTLYGSYVKRLRIGREYRRQIVAGFNAENAKLSTVGAPTLTVPIPGTHGDLFRLVVYIGIIVLYIAGWFSLMTSQGRPATSMAEAGHVIPEVLKGIYSSLNEGRLRDASPILSQEIMKSQPALDYLCRPSTHRAHYIVSLAQQNDGTYLVRERVLFQPLTEQARLLSFKCSDGACFLFAANDDPFTTEVESASNTVRQFIFAARAKKWDLAARYVSPHFPIDQMKSPDWESYLSQIGGVEIRRYIHNPEIRKIDRGTVRNDAGIVMINVHATLEGHNWFPDFLVDPTSGKIVKAFFPERMGMYTNNTGAPIADGITDPGIELDALRRFNLIRRNGQVIKSAMNVDQGASQPGTTETNGTLDVAKRAIADVMRQLYSALNDGDTQRAAPFVTQDIIKSPETLDYLCQPFNYRAHYIVSVVELPDGSFLARGRTLFKPFSERAYLLYFKESGGKFYLYRAEDDPFNLERETAVDAVRQFIFAAQAGKWEVVKRYASPHLPIDEMQTPDWQQYLSRIGKADQDGQVSVNLDHGITLGLRFNVRNFEDPDFLFDPASGKVVRAFFKIGTGFTNLSRPPSDSGISDPDFDKYVLARFGLPPNN